MKKILSILSLGLTFFTVGLFALFVCLKLDGLIIWSWWLVCAPIWVPFATALFLVIVALCSIKFFNNEKTS